MVASNGHAGPTETSPLLSKDTVVSIDTTANGSPNGVIEVRKVIDGAQTDGAADEEAGEAEELDNPIFEGLPEVAARLHILAPAVAIGVSF